MRKFFRDAFDGASGSFMYVRMIANGYHRRFPVRSKARACCSTRKATCYTCETRRACNVLDDPPKPCTTSVEPGAS